MLVVVFNEDTVLADREFAVQAIQLPVALVRQGDLDLTRAADALHIWWRFSIEGEMSVEELKDLETEVRRLPGVAMVEMYIGFAWLPLPDDEADEI
jgi:hypothetical protein